MPCQILARRDSNSVRLEWGSVSVSFVGKIVFNIPQVILLHAQLKNHCSGRPTSFYKNRGDCKEIETSPSCGEKSYRRKMA